MSGDPKLFTDRVVRYNVETMAYEQDTMNDETLRYEQLIMDYVMDEELMFSRGLIKNEIPTTDEEGNIIRWPIPIKLWMKSNK